MATRAVIIIKDEQSKHLCTIYKHWDGYPEGLGRTLANFVRDGKLVNGISSKDLNSKCWNGLGCFTASLIAHLKTQIGDVYIEPEGTDFGEEYEYTLKPDGDTISITTFDVYEGEVI